MVSSKPRIVRAYYVGSVPVMYLWRNTGPEGQENLYIQTTRGGHPVKTVEEADAEVVKLLRTPPAPTAGGYPPPSGYRVVFTVAAPTVEPTSDAAEAAANPKQVLCT